MWDDISACGSEYSLDGPQVGPTGDSVRECLLSEQLDAILIAERFYMARSCNEEDSDEEQWRLKITQWSFRVIDHFGLDREVVSVAINLLDRYMSVSAISCSIDSRSFQLVAMTCLYLAMKVGSDNVSVSVHSRRKKLKLSSFVDLSRGQFEAKDIVRMEGQVLQTLAWKVSPPTPMTCVKYLLSLFSISHDPLVRQVVRDLARYLTELSVCLGSDLSTFLPSQVAAASIIVAMDLLTSQAMSQETRHGFYDTVQGLWSTGDDLPYLCNRLRDSLSPDMILREDADMEHPITVANTYGMLRLGQHHEVRAATPPGTPKHRRVGSGCSIEVSPVSTLR